MTATADAAAAPPPTATLGVAARGWLLVGIAGLVLAVVAGIWAGVLLAFGYSLPSGAAFQFGRLRPVHTRLAVHLWLLPTALGVIFASLRRGPTGKVQRLLPTLWGLVQAVACVLLVAEGVQGPPYAEVIPALDLVSGALLVVAAGPIARALRRGANGHEGTGLLYAAEFLVWAVALTLFVRGVLPWFDGASAAALHRAWLADSIGLVVTPAAAAAAYLVLPRVTGGRSRRPWLGRLGFSILAFTYVFAGGRHALFGPQPEILATAGWLSSLAIGIPSFALAWNLIESVWRGRATTPAQRGAAAWLLLGAVLWLLLAAQGMVQSIPAVNALVSKTDWVAGHAHLGMLGAVGALLTGAVQAILADTPRPPVRSAAVLRWCWVIALLGMLWALTERSFREMDDNLAAVPYAMRFHEIQGMWHMRLSAGLLLLVAVGTWGVFAARSLLATEASTSASTIGSESRPVGAAPLLRRSVAAALVGGLGMGLVVIAVPRTSPAVDDHPGWAVYRREGCVQCHTLASRPLDADFALFGPPPALEQATALQGTRRIGPDLSGVGSRRSRDWLRTHLVEPTAQRPEHGHRAVPKTAMPSFAFLPEEDREALVDWLASLR